MDDIYFFDNWNMNLWNLDIQILKLELSKCQPLKIAIFSYKKDDGLSFVKHC